MKKIIVSISIIVVIIVAAVVMAFALIKRTTEIIMESSDNRTKIILGEYVVSNYKVEKMHNTIITFSVESKNEFYNDFIKQNKGYKKELDYDVDGVFVFGFLVYDDYLIQYVINEDNKIALNEVLSEWSIEEENLSSYYDKILSSEYQNYYLIGPMNYYLSYGRINGDEEYYKYDSLPDERITFNMLVNMYSFISSDYYKFEGNSIYLKGYYYGEIVIDGDSWHFNNENQLYLTEVYLVKISLKDNKIVVENADK